MHKINVRFDWFPNTNHTGFLLAQEKGYFKEAGLDVTLFGDVHGTLRIEDADIVCAPEMSLLQEIQKNQSLTAIATLTQRCDSGIVSLKSANIRSPKDLEGKRLTHWEPNWFHPIIGELMRIDGGDYTKVVRVPMDVGDIVSTLGVSADATWVYENWEIFELLEHGKEIDYIALADVDPLFNFCAPCVAATRTLIEEAPDVVTRFMEAIQRGYVEAATHPEESVLRVKHLLPNVSESMLIQSQKHLSKIFLDSNGVWGTIIASRWNRMADFMIEHGLYDMRRDTEYTNAFIHKMDSDDSV